MSASFVVKSREAVYFLVLPCTPLLGTVSLTQNGDIQTTVTVIIAAWNAKDTIDRAISSAFAQDGVHVDVIVVDDASQVPVLPASMKDPRLRVVRLQENGGPARARNRAFDCSTGQWIAVLDADDWMHPDRLRRMTELAEEVCADVVLGNFTACSENGQERVHVPLEAIDPRHPVSLADYVERDSGAFGSASIGYLKPIFRSEFFAKHGLRYNEALRVGEDFHMVLSALAVGAKVHIDSEPDYFYSTGHDSISHRPRPETLQAIVEADTEFLEKLGNRASPELTQKFRQRAIAQLDLVACEKVLGDLKRKDVVAALRNWSARPRASQRILQHIMQGGLRRFQAGLARQVYSEATCKPSKKS